MLLRQEDRGLVGVAVGADLLRDRLELLRRRFPGLAEALDLFG